MVNAMRSLFQAIAYYLGGLVALAALASVGAASGPVEPLAGKGALVIMLGAAALVVSATLHWLILIAGSGT